MNITPGKAIKKARQAQGLTLNALSLLTAIPMKYLRRLEEEKWKELPAPVYVKGFLAKCAEVLKIDKKELLRSFPRLEASRNSPSLSLPKKTFSLKIGTVIVFVFLTGFLAFLWQETKVFFSPPPLVLNLPPKSIESPGESFLLKGRTSPQARVIVNGQPVPVDNRGNFSLLISFNEGLNILRVVSQDRFGNQNIVIRKIVKKYKN